MTTDIYRELASQTPLLPLFMQPFWLDAVAPAWGVCGLTDAQGQLTAVLVFEKQSKWGQTRLLNPPLTPFCGIWCAPQRFKSAYVANTFYKNTHAQLLAQVPDVGRIDWRLHPSTTDWQTFFWQGFEQTTRYTYRLDLPGLDASLYAENTRRNIKKSYKKYQFIAWDHTENIFQSAFGTVVMSLLDSPYRRQERKNPVSKAVWQRVESVLAKKEGRTVFLARDTEGVQAMIYVVFDQGTVYYLAGGSTASGRQAGALAGLLALAIETAQDKGYAVFDFEGSMLAGVEHFFRGFNAVQTPYFVLKKDKYWWWKLWDIYKNRR